MWRCGTPGADDAPMSALLRFCSTDCLNNSSLSNRVGSSGLALFGAPSIVSSVHTIECQLHTFPSSPIGRRFLVQLDSLMVRRADLVCNSLSPQPARPSNSVGYVAELSYSNLANQQARERRARRNAISQTCVKGCRKQQRQRQIQVLAPTSTFRISCATGWCESRLLSFSLRCSRLAQTRKSNSASRSADTGATLLHRTKKRANALPRFLSQQSGCFLSAVFTLLMAA